MDITAHAALQQAMDFDHPVRITDAGTITDAGDVYAPAVSVDDDGVLSVDGIGWELLTGYTQQYGYSGPVMHASEQLGGRLADDILTTPGVYVAVVVEVEGDDVPAGWAVARQV